MSVLKNSRSKKMSSCDNEREPSGGVSLKNHGALTVGSNLKEAFCQNIILEKAAKILFISKTIGTPRILSPSEVEGIEDLAAEAYRRKLLKNLESIT